MATSMVRLLPARGFEQQQEFMGIPASGQKIRVEGMNFYRLKDGRVTDLWTQFDGAPMMPQLGALPA